MSHVRMGLLLSTGVGCVAALAAVLLAGGDDQQGDLTASATTPEAASPYDPTLAGTADFAPRRLTAEAIEAGVDGSVATTTQIADGLSTRGGDFESGYYLRAHRDCIWAFLDAPDEKFQTYGDSSSIRPVKITSRFFWSDGCGPWTRVDY